MSKGKRNRAKRTALLDQCQAAASETAVLFSRLDGLEDARAIDNGGQRTGFHIEALRRLAAIFEGSIQARTCGHLIGPQPGHLFLNINALVCTECLGRMSELVDQMVDDKCDFCEERPDNNNFATIVIPDGMTISYGHACDACLERLGPQVEGLPPELERKAAKYAAALFE